MNPQIFHDESGAVKKLPEQIQKKKEFIAMLEKHNDVNADLILQAEDEKTVVAQATRQLLIGHTIDMEKKIDGQKKELASMERYHEGEYKERFEKTSREANLNIAAAIKKAEVSISRNPTAATSDSLKAILTKWTLEKDSIDQQDKNEIYTSINTLLNAMKKK